jgi:hypothetical protein
MTNSAMERRSIPVAEFRVNFSVGDIFGLLPNISPELDASGKDFDDVF